MVAATAALIAPGVAAAHAIVLPSASRPAELQRYTLTVPNERDVPTISVRLTVPEGISFFVAENTRGWRAHIERNNGRVVAISFDGGSIQPGFYDSFRFIAKNPVREGTIAWNVRQSYAGGEVVDWSGPPHSDTPASQTEISESAAVVDAIDVVSGRTAAAAAATPGPSARSGHDRLALMLSLAALGLALVAAATTLFRGRPLV